MCVRERNTERQRERKKEIHTVSHEDIAVSTISQPAFAIARALASDALDAKCENESEDRKRLELHESRVQRDEVSRVQPYP